MKNKQFICRLINRKSGSGKSTLQLLMRIRDVKIGSIKINNLE